MVADHGNGLTVERRVDGQIQGDDGIASGDGRKGINKDTADGVWVTIPEIWCLMVADYGNGLPVERWVDGQIQGDDGIASCDGRKCINKDSANGVWVTIPEVWRLMVADYSNGLTVERRVDGQIQGDDGVASGDGRKGINKDTADEVWITIPEVWRLVVADHGIGLTVERWMDGQIQGDDGITTGDGRKSVDKDSANSIGVTIP